MADGEESVKQNREETLEGSSGEDEETSRSFNTGQNDETVKTFKDLVSFHELKWLSLMSTHVLA